MAHTINPSTWETEAGRSLELEASLGYTMRPSLYGGGDTKLCLIEIIDLVVICAFIHLVAYMWINFSIY